MIKIVFAKGGEEKGRTCIHPTNHEQAAPQDVSYCCSLGLHSSQRPCLKHVCSSTWCYRAMTKPLRGEAQWALSHH